jgi:hypothetical protein
MATVHTLVDLLRALDVTAAIDSRVHVTKKISVGLAHGTFNVYNNNKLVETATASTIVDVVQKYIGK